METERLTKSEAVELLEQQVELKIEKCRLDEAEKQWAQAEREAQYRRSLEAESKVLRQVTRNWGDHIYTGGMLNNLREGPSKSTFTNGMEVTATYIEGKLHGEVVETRGDYRRVTNYDHGVRHGEETCVDHRGRMCRLFDHGEKVGCIQIVYKNDDIFVREYIDGEFDPDDPGMFSSAGVRYHGKKPYLTRDMWDVVSDMWGGVPDAEHQCNPCIVLVGFFMLAMIIAASVATPFTWTYDTVVRRIRQL